MNREQKYYARKLKGILQDSGSEKIVRATISFMLQIPGVSGSVFEEIPELWCYSGNQPIPSSVLLAYLFEVIETSA